MAEPVVIYHNPNCSKSRQTLELLRARGVEPEVVPYLKQPLDRDTLRRLVDLLPVEPATLVRGGDARTKYQLDPGDYTTAAHVVDLLSEHGDLMERPVVVRGDRAVLGRPPENALSLL